MVWQRWALVCVWASITACSTPSKISPHHPRFSVKIQPVPLNRIPAAENVKHVVIQKCTADKVCGPQVETMSYNDFAQKLDQKIQIKSFLSQQVALLEQKVASLQVDRNFLQNEIDLLAKDHQHNRLSSLRGLVKNAKTIRESLKQDLQNVETQLARTEKDLQALKNASSSGSTTAQLLKLLESHPEFGDSLAYQDNLIAQELDSLLSEIF